MAQKTADDVKNIAKQQADQIENLGKITTHEHVRLDNEKNSKRVGNLLKSVGIKLLFLVVI